MSDLAIVALVLGGLWLGVFSLAVLLLIRQVGLLTVRLDRLREEGSPVNDGIPVGEEVPDSVRSLLTGIDDSTPSYALVLGAVCAPCRELLADLEPGDITYPVVALVGGREELTQEVLQLAPEGIKPVGGAPAQAALEALQVSTTPMVFELRHGRVFAKAVLRGADHFLRFVEEGQRGNGNVGLTIEEVVPDAG